MIYKLNLSTKQSLKITSEELEKFKQNVDKNFIEFSEGIVNPSFVTSIIIDWEETRAENKKNRSTPAPQLEAPDMRGTKTIKDILEKSRPKFLN